MIKKLMTFLLALSMMVTMAACGNTASNPDGNSQPTTQTGNNSNGEVAELVFWDMMWGRSDSYPETVQALVDKFNSEHENIHVTAQILPWDNFYQQFLTAVTSGAAPDISTGGFSQSTQYAAMDELVDLSSIVAEWEAEGFIKNFPEGSIELHQYNGMQAGIPWIIDPRVITYRKDVFEQAGITKLPTTWDEFLDVCETIKTKTGMTPLVIPGDRDGAQVFLSMMFENGVGVTDSSVNPAFDSSGVGEVLSYVQTLYEKGYISSSTASYTDPDMDSMLLSGNAAMCYGALRTTVYKSGDPIAETLGVMPSISSNTNNSPRTLMWVNPIVAYSQTEHPEEAKVFIKWWIENMLPLFTDGGVNGYPANKGLLEDKFFNEMPYIAEAINNAVPYGTSPVWPSANLYTAWSVIEGENYLGMALQEIVTGNKDHTAIQKKYQGLIEQAFKDAE